MISRLVGLMLAVGIGALSAALYGRALERQRREYLHEIHHTAGDAYAAYRRGEITREEWSRTLGENRPNVDKVMTIIGRGP